MTSRHCPACGSPAIPACWSSDDLLIIGDAPTRQDFLKGTPYSTNAQYMTAGKVLRREMQRVGLALHEHRVMYLWMHEPTKNENCFQAGYDAVLEEARGKKAILLVGADVVNTFTDYKVSDVSGLEVDSPILSAPHIMAMISPALALSRAYGEVRFAVEQWKELLERENLI